MSGRSLLGTGASRILSGDVYAEIGRAQEKFGRQLDLPDGTTPAYHLLADRQKHLVSIMARQGSVTWQAILREELLEACAETDPVLLRAELVQVAAVAVRWIDAIDNRHRTAEELT